MIPIGREFRIPVAEGKVKLESDSPQQVDIVNLSRTGMFVRGVNNLRPGEKINFHVTTPDKIEIDGQSEVRWVQNPSKSYQQSGAGLKILRFNGDGKASFDEFVDLNLSLLAAHQLLSQDYLAASIDEKLIDIKSRLFQNAKNTVVVLNDGKPVGTISSIRLFTQKLPDSMLVHRAMNTHFLTVSATSSVEDVLGEIRQTFDKDVVVVDKEKFVGIVSLPLLLSYWYEAQLGRHRKHRRNLMNEAAMVAHDLRSPTTLIATTASLLTDTDMTLEEFIKIGYPELIQQGCQQILNLTEDIIDYASYEKRSHKLVKEPVDLNQFLLQLVKDYQTKAKAHGISLSDKLCQSTVVRTTDKSRLQRILQNLIDNSFKYCLKGSSIEVELSETAGRANIKIKDNGPGIPEDQLQSIFQLFQTCEEHQPTTKIGGQRFGVGLAVCQKLCHLLGIDLTVESKEGKGTIFHLIL